MTRLLSLTCVLFASVGFAADPPKVSDLALEDQFEKKNSVADHKGKVLILVYGDRSGLDASRELGSKLHVLFHPTAEGKTAKEAKAAPVAALDGVAKGTASPDVAVVPVACCGKVPGAVQGFIRGALKKDAGDTTVWLDFANVMKDKFGLTDGEPNLVVIDAQGRLRLKVNGSPDKETLQKVLQTTQNLRAEAAGLR
jgi:predicted transcriptional regulator